MNRRRLPSKVKATSKQEAGKGKADGPDFSDVAPEHLEEVTALVNDLEVMNAESLGLDGLRRYLGVLRRMCGFSREATIQLTRVLTDCLSTTSSARDNLQKAFQRMGGVNTSIYVLMLWLSDPILVANCARLLAAAVQGSPLAAETIVEHGSENILMLLRVIERHMTNANVVREGCTLIAHLCAPMPRTDTDTRAIRARGYRACQKMLADAGAIDLLIEILVKSMAEMEEASKKVGQILSFGAKAQDGGGNGQSTAKTTPLRPKEQRELREAWAKVNSLEGSVAQVQEACLQAIVLVSCGHKDVTRMLAGVLWAHESANMEKKAAIRQEQLAKERALALKQPAQQDRRRRGGRNAPDETEEAPRKDCLAQKYPMGSFDAFARTVILASDLLEGQTTKDRPPLAAKACRMILLLCEFHIDLIGQVEHKAREHALLSGHKNVAMDDSPLGAPFAPVEPVVSALLCTLRRHAEDVPALNAALQALLALRNASLRSAPAGSDPDGKDVEYAWQKVLASAEQAGELNRAAQTLETSVRETQVGNQRIRDLGVSPEDLMGGGAWLTPRMYEAAKTSRETALTLASDIVGFKWERGEPGRKEKLEQASEVKEQISGLLTKGGKGGKGERRLSTKSRRSVVDSERPSPSSTMSGESSDLMSEISKLSKKGKGKKKVSVLESTNENDPNHFESAEWVRALGYGEHDEADFERVWKKPLYEVMSRSFSDPTVRRATLAEIGGRLGSTSGASEPVGQSMDDRGVPPENLDIQMLESTPGKLRVRVVVPSHNRVRQTVSDTRLQQLVARERTVKSVTQELSKHFRQEGCLLPRYGIEVNIKKGRLRNTLGSDYIGSDVSPSSTLPPITSSPSGP
mmetsp:Transcript_118436/g.334858  ORF Transcript_118436/g.334858 Transcript_118436/m.334858 type:complete len:862 (-) Transcript_118436:210-2795(-)